MFHIGVEIVQECINTVHLMIPLFKNQILGSHTRRGNILHPNTECRDKTYLNCVTVSHLCYFTVLTGLGGRFQRAEATFFL